MKGKRVNTSQYATEVYAVTGRNVEDIEAIICQNCIVVPDCNPRHPNCGLKILKEARRQQRKVKNAKI